MARPKKSVKKGARGSARSVRLKPEQFRSMILDKLRMDIDAKRAAFDQAKKLGIKDLGNMSYYKMKYWKMKYWKKGAEILGHDAVINPAISMISGVVARKKRVR